MTLQTSVVGLAIALALLPGCGADSGPDDAPDAASPDLPAADVALDPRLPPPPDDTGPGAYLASVASGPLFAPLGVSTAGYAQELTGDSPLSPFAGGFQATTTVLHPPRVQVIQLVRGDTRLVLAQTDLIGLQGRLFDRVLQRVEQMSGQDLTPSLVLMANHTHSGPGHLFQGMIAPLVADSYDEVYVERTRFPRRCPGTPTASAPTPWR